MKSRLSYKQQFQLAYKLTTLFGSKRSKICAYLIRNISPQTYQGVFNRGKIIKKFHCTRQTVELALKKLKALPYIYIDGSLIGYKKSYLKGGKHQND